MTTCKINSAGLALIKSFEGCKLTAYVCPAGVLTIGWGTTGPEVTKGLKITQAQADSWLIEDVNKFADGVDKLVTVKLTENQKAALTSFAYNCGLGNLKSSTLLRKVNAKDFKGAKNEFQKWDRAGGKTLPGLTRRRAAEAELFVSG